MRCPACDADNVPGAALCEGCGLDLAGLDTPEADDGFTGRLMRDRVRDLRIVPPLTLAAGASVRQAIELLRRERHGCVLVEDEDRLAGIFTERDVLTRVVRRGLDPDAVTMREVMTPDPYVLAAGDPPAFAIHKMVVAGLRHLPVVEGEKILGFISVRNVLRYVRDDVLAE